MIDLKSKKHLHFVGIKGAGMSALAIVAKERGFTVSGTDVDETFITDEALKKAKIKVSSGFSTDHINKLSIEKNKVLVITTGAHGGMNNPEVVFAKKRGIDAITYAEVLGVFMSEKKSVSVAGSHGKTTTSAMIAHLLIKGGLDPSFVVGCGKIASLETSGHWGSGAYFVAEADEYVADLDFDCTPKLLYQHPTIAVITNIDYDHPDVFPSLDAVGDVFLKFTKNIKPDGLLVACCDDGKVRKLLPFVNNKIITYGFSRHAMVRIAIIETREKRTKFALIKDNKKFGTFILTIPGRQNVLNATASIIVGYHVGIQINTLQKNLAEFLGSKRRFEFIGETQKKAFLYDDYGHHPTEISATLAAAKKHFPNKRIIVIFQPHTYSRTKALLSDFARALSGFDKIYILDIFPSAREKKDPTVDANSLVLETKKHNKKVWYAKSEGVLIDMLKKELNSNDMIFTMGAGDVYRLHPQILKQC